MEKKRIYQLVSFCVITLFFCSCNKIKKDTRNFMEEGRWTFEELMFDGDMVDNLPYWDLNSDANAQGYKSGTWTHATGESANFYWMFNNYGNLDFYLDPELKVDLNRATLQCNNLSGEYDVITGNSKEYVLESIETLGYPGTTVQFKMVAN